MTVGWVVNAIVFFLLLAITAVTVIGGLAALVHAISTRPDAFPAVDTKSKGFWVGILLASTLVAGLLGAQQLLMSPLGLFYLAAVVGISVYLAEVRPRVDEIQGKSWFRKAA
ncbi:DUF2516 domain-containing protein [Gordonia iterans]|uniref:DUF2516 domain-containing protein n=1 Tax=Gordonia iterans TaxID=1004901 RepID=A0A2S0KJB8_9ACTN|nr:DUF2516 family protein [Gordonia iterans]AVM01782.1 DUF2516 domain-containing protein [Gordonia iterans]